MRMDFSQVNDLGALRWYSVLFTDCDYTSSLSLFHYTTADAVEKIIKNNCIDLRLTRADSFADVDEGKHFINVFDDACLNCKAKGIITDSFYDILQNAAKDYSSICEESRKLYVCCFSKNENNNYLIQNYACKNGTEGVVIGFQEYEIENVAFRKFGEDYPIQLIDVLYDLNELSNYIQKLIARMYDLRSQDASDNSIVKRIVISQLASYCLAYKHASFSEEQEVRLIIDFSGIPKECLEIVADTDPKYIHLILDENALYNIRKVTI